MVISRTTIRAALQRLEHDGVVSRQRAIGTRVVLPDEDRFQLDLGRLSAPEELLRHRGHESNAELIDVRREMLPSLSGQMGFAAGASDT